MIQILQFKNNKNTLPGILTIMPGPETREGEFMKRIYKLFCLMFIITVISINTVVFAENETENNLSVEVKTETEDNIEESEMVDKLVDNMESILDPDNNELQETIEKTLEKHSKSKIVKFFKIIIEAVKKLLDSILKLASEAAKIGVE